MTVETMELSLGQEKPVRLPTGEWSYRVEGMASAVSVTKMWTSDPYPDDDDDGNGAGTNRPPRAMVFMVRGAAPGRASVTFIGPRGSREVRVTVRP